MKKILIVQARFYENISDLLLSGATSQIKALGYEHEIVDVLGALESPPLIALAQKNQNYAGFIALGCVIRGETSHYDIVANESARALMDLATNHNLAIGNAILTVENENQAIVRADSKQKDKGGFAVKACVRMIELKQRFI